MKILYVEDNKDLGLTSKFLLEGCGHKVTWVQHRANLPQDFSRFDMVVSDFEVPGGEFSETQRRCFDLGIPLLLVSGKREAHEVHSMFLNKPFRLDDFLSIVNNISKKQRGYL